MKTKSKTRKLSKSQCSRKPVSQEVQLQNYIKSQQSLEQKRIQAILDKPHTLSMEFILEDVVERLHAFSMSKPEHKNEDIYIPESVVIDAYNQQDLIIALKMQQVDCENWLVGIDTHFYNLEKDQALTLPLQVQLNGLNYTELNLGAEVMVARESGISTQWKGLHTELNDSYKEYDLSGFELCKTQVKIIASCYFKNYKMYQEYLLMTGLRSQNALIPLLDQMANDMVLNKALDEDFQPADKNLTAIPADAFKLLAQGKEQSDSIFLMAAS